MEIPEIKRQLRITQVLDHYGLKLDRNQRLLCPFHPDKAPSLQVYPQTDTFCCFSTNCQAGTGDVIRFIELKEPCSKHEAILKAQALIDTVSLQTPSIVPAGHDLDRLAVLAKVFQFFKAALTGSKKAASYLEGRSLDYKQHEIGYNSGGLPQDNKNHYLVQSMVKWGLLKPNTVKGYSVWGKDCVIFPLRDTDHKVVSLYGRSITNNSDQRHFYLSGRSGLYPGYPDAATTRLILTESIIDAESLLQQASIREQYSVLALYGTNGLTDEHITAIQGLRGLEEIILMLDGDEAGAQGTIKHAHTLRDLCPQVHIKQVILPEGEDVNSLLQSHDDAQILTDLIGRRIDFSFSMEPLHIPESQPTAVSASPGLDTNSTELLIYTDMVLRIEVLGGIKLTGLDRLRVTLKVTCRGKGTLPVWHSLDLYNHGQREQAIGSLAEVFDTNVQATAATIAQLTESLEQYRRSRIEALQTKAPLTYELTAVQAQAAINELKKPNLLDRTSQLIGLSGIVGETTNGLIAYLVYTMRKGASPLHVMFMGASGSGKTYLQERISELIPPEDKIEITQITGNALYYFKQEELKHKLILIEDLDGVMDVLYPLRELQTKRRITKTVTLKDSKGNLKTITLTVEGPVCVSGCTTKEKLYEDNANRCILLYIDASKEQDKRITEYQALVASGETNRPREHQVQQLFQHIQRVLKPVKVVNPFAKYIQLPEEVFKPRRTMTLLLGFIEAITFYHQYQREIKRDKEGQPYITTTPEDIAAAFALLKEVLFTKSDELTRATRSFLEYLKTYLKAEGKASFAAKEIRAALRIPPSSLKRYLMELERYGYVKGVGNRYRNYAYTITSMEEYERLKSSIDGHLASILEQIRPASQWPSGSAVA
jgi:DNA primase/DNA-binding MarR family transcriptional regulator